MKTRFLMMPLLLAGMAFSYSACSEEDDNNVTEPGIAKSVLSVEQNCTRVDCYLTNEKREQTTIFHEGEEIYLNIDVTNSATIADSSQWDWAKQISYQHYVESTELTKWMNRIWEEQEKTGLEVDKTVLPSDSAFLAAYEAWLKDSTYLSAKEVLDAHPGPINISMYALHSSPSFGIKLFQVFSAQGKDYGVSWERYMAVTQIYITLQDGKRYHISIPWYFKSGSEYRTGNDTYFPTENIPRLKAGNYYAMAPVHINRTVQGKNHNEVLTCRIDFQIVK